MKKFLLFILLLASNRLYAKDGATVVSQHAPLLFIENNGQVIDDAGNRRPDILFTANAGGARVYITANSLHYVFTRVEGHRASISEATGQSTEETNSSAKTSTHRFTVSLKGANPAARLVKEVPNPYYENHYLTHCPQGITANSYERIRLVGVYPGVDWVIYNNGTGLKYDFVVAEARLAHQIRLQISGATAALQPNGELRIESRLGNLVEDRPVSFQNGKEILSHFQRRKDGTYGFALRGASQAYPITIDPAVIWSTYYGGTMGDQVAHSVTNGSTGDHVITGSTWSSNFPVAAGFQATTAGDQEAYLLKISATGTRLWATYLGGTGEDIAAKCAIDQSGNIITVGGTTSYNFPIASAFQTNHAPGTDVYLAKFDASGTRLWATYYGGNGLDFALSCVTDANDNIYFSGHTSSTDFPVSNAFQSTLGGTNNNRRDAMLVKFDASGSRLWATYFGGSQQEDSRHCAIDAQGNVFLTGSTYSTDLPVASAYQPTPSAIPFYDLFVAKFSPAGARLWASYYGGNSDDVAWACAVDLLGNLIIVGSSTSTNLATVGAHQTSRAGDEDAFIMKIDGSGIPIWSTYYGGAASDVATICNTDVFGNIVVAGSTKSSNFPVSPAMQTGSTKGDAFVLVLDAAGMRQWAMCLGGSEKDDAYGCSIDANGQVFVAGQTMSSNFQTTSGAPQPAFAGGPTDLFLTRIDGTITSTRTRAKVGITLLPNPVHESATVQVTGAELRSATLHDALGRKVGSYVLQGQEGSIQRGGLPAGTYLINIQTTTETVTRQIILE